MWNFPVFPPQASEHAVKYDHLFFTITGLTIFFSIFVAILVVFLAVRYRRGSKVDRRNPLTHSLPLELTWLLIPLVLGLGIFAWGTVNYLDQRRIPEDSMEVFVIGKQWMWHLQHMNGIRENNELHVPVGRAIKMTMISQDVIHAMYLPDFRTQYHVVPGRYTQLWFKPTKPGTYKMLCAIHCGNQHSEMVGYVHVLSQEDYIRWVEQRGNRFVDIPLTMQQAGLQVWNNKRCFNCHGDVDSARAPSLRGLFGKSRVFSDGNVAVADEEYIRRSILRPYDEVVSGYDMTMPAYAGQLTEEQVLQLISYIKTLGVAPAAQDGTRMYEAPPAATAETPSSPETATDIANKLESAGASQAQQLEHKR